MEAFDIQIGQLNEGDKVLDERWIIIWLNGINFGVYVGVSVCVNESSNQTIWNIVFNYCLSE